MRLPISRFFDGVSQRQVWTTMVHLKIFLAIFWATLICLRLHIDHTYSAVFSLLSNSFHSLSAFGNGRSRIEGSLRHDAAQEHIRSENAMFFASAKRVRPNLSSKGITTTTLAATITSAQEPPIGSVPGTIDSF